MLILAGLVLAACGGSDGAAPRTTSDDAGSVRVVASLEVLADLVREVGGARVRVDAVVPAGADVHTFSVSPGGVQRVAAADLVVIVGAGLESGFSDTIRANAKRGALVLADSLPLQPFPAGFADPDAAPGALDPHFWLDADLTVEALAILRDALTEIDPEGAEVYRANTEAYTAQVRALDEEIRAVLAALPPERTFLVTFHDAFGYLARRYGLTILGFVVEGPEEEPGAGAIAALVQTMRERGVRFIYREPPFDAAIVEQIAREAGAAVRVLRSDSLDADVPTYVDLMRANAHALSD